MKSKVVKKLAFILGLVASISFTMSSCKQGGMEPNQSQVAISKTYGHIDTSTIHKILVVDPDSVKVATSKRLDQPVIDTMKVLHEFDNDKFQFEECDDFSIEVLHELNPYRWSKSERKTHEYPHVTVEQEKLLNVTEYICDRSFNPHYALDQSITA